MVTTGTHWISEMTPDWTSDDGSVQLYYGDCLKILPTLAPGSVDAVVTDPPYNTTNASSIANKSNLEADWNNAAFWFSAWMQEFRRLAPRGCVWTCSNWRTLPVYQHVSARLSWPIESVLVWYKDGIGPGGARGLRPSYEMVALWCAGDFALLRRDLYDMQTFPWSSRKPNGHPAEKPVELMKWLVAISTSAEQTILDPFMGSGTTGIAARQLGRKFIGIEIEPKYFEIAKRRIQDELVMPLQRATREPELFEEK
jgi:DNA modification methylase